MGHCLNRCGLNVLVWICQNHSLIKNYRGIFLVARWLVNVIKTINKSPNITWMPCVLCLPMYAPVRECVFLCAHRTLLGILIQLHQQKKKACLVSNSAISVKIDFIVNGTTTLHLNFYSYCVSALKMWKNYT